MAIPLSRRTGPLCAGGHLVVPDRFAWCFRWSHMTFFGRRSPNRITKATGLCRAFLYAGEGLLQKLIDLPQTSVVILQADVGDLYGRSEAIEA
jgi:hypothetical protein